MKMNTCGWREWERMRRKILNGADVTFWQALWAKRHFHIDFFISSELVCVLPLIMSKCHWDKNHKTMCFRLIIKLFTVRSLHRVCVCVCSKQKIRVSRWYFQYLMNMFDLGARNKIVKKEERFIWLCLCTQERFCGSNTEYSHKHTRMK
jgi:hypothetical protein